MLALWPGIRDGRDHGPGTPAWAQGIPDYAAVVEDLDRSDADRRPTSAAIRSQLLEFTGVRLGMKVLDMGAGGGYSTELMTRAVGPDRHRLRAESRGCESARERAVCDAAGIRRRWSGRSRWSSRSTIRCPPGLGDFDLITFFFYYHDTTYMAVDRAQMNRKLYEALKPGGMLVIADHSAKPGEGISVGKTLHRIEESVLRRRGRGGGLQAGRGGATSCVIPRTRAISR